MSESHSLLLALVHLLEGLAWSGRRDAPNAAGEHPLVERFGREAWAVLDGVAPSRRENAYDAAAVALAVWDRPEVAGLRRISGSARGGDEAPQLFAPGNEGEA